MPTKVIRMFVCPEGCKRKSDQRLAYKKLGKKKTGKVQDGIKLTTPIPLHAADGYFLEWLCPGCGGKMEKKEVKVSVRPSKKALDKIKKKQSWGYGRGGEKSER